MFIASRSIITPTRSDGLSSHAESAGSVETGPVKPEKSCLPLDGPSGRDLLKRILMEVKEARREIEGREKEKRKPGYYKQVAIIIDSVFFFLYFATVVTFLTFMYIMWVANGLWCCVLNLPMHAFKFNDDGFLHKQQSNPSMIRLLLLFQSAQQISDHEFTTCIYCFDVNSQDDRFFFHFILCLNVSLYHCKKSFLLFNITLNFYIVKKRDRRRTWGF